MTLAGRRRHSPNLLAPGPAAHRTQAPRAVTLGPGGGVSMRPNALAQTAQAGPLEPAGRKPVLLELDGGREGAVCVGAALASGRSGLDAGRQDFGKEGRSQAVS